jgi:hypothetical protein
MTQIHQILKNFFPKFPKFYDKFLYVAKNIEEFFYKNFIFSM